jgi:lipopolysaccharide export LptBFGC system permease protein LptF
MNVTTIIRASISLIVLAMLCGAMGLLAFVPIPEGNRDQFNMLLGALTGVGLGTVLGFWLGSSQASANKDTTIQELSRRETQ